MMRRGGRRRGPGLIGTVARTAVVAGTATATVGLVHKAMAPKPGEQEEAPADEAPPPQAEAQPEVVYAAPPPQPAAIEGLSMDDKLAQLKQLGELRDSGVLTDIEFEAQKERILGQ